MAIEIVDFSIKHGDFPVRYVNIYQRVNLHCFRPRGSFPRLLKGSTHPRSAPHCLQRFAEQAMGAGASTTGIAGIAEKEMKSLREKPQAPGVSFENPLTDVDEA